MVKIKSIAVEEIPPIRRGRKQKPFYHKFHDNIKKYVFERSGFTIERSSYTKKGPDIIANAEGKKIIVQCKCAKNSGTVISGLDSLVDEYSKKLDKMSAHVAVLALGKYELPREYTFDKREEILGSDRVAIWTEKDITKILEAFTSLGAM